MVPALGFIVPAIATLNLITHFFQKEANEIKSPNNQHHNHCAEPVAISSIICRFHRNQKKLLSKTSIFKITNNYILVAMQKNY